MARRLPKKLAIAIMPAKQHVLTDRYLEGAMQVTKTPQPARERRRSRTNRPRPAPGPRATSRAEHLMRAALKLFAVKDFTRITLRDIQKASGFDAALIYYYFR